MWLFDSLLVTALTGFYKFAVVLPSLIYCLWSIFTYGKAGNFELFA